MYLSNISRAIFSLSSWNWSFSYSLICIESEKFNFFLGFYHFPISIYHLTLGCFYDVQIIHHVKFLKGITFLKY